LRELLAYKVPKKNNRFLLAELLSIKTNSYRQMMVLDRGKKDQVFIGQAVFDASGVIGQVIEVGPFTSTVMLITDHKSAVPVKNSRSGERSILVGSTVTGNLSLINLSRTSSVQVGDKLLTSGLGRRFPEGYPVGVVKHIHRNMNNAFITVNVKPTAQISKSRLMLLTWHNEKDQLLLKELSELAKKNTNKRSK
jgi:rod shape-determining protein MreC